MNMWLIGIFVLVIHDISDFFLILARGYRDYKYLNKKILKLIYVFAAGSWVFCRLFLLSLCCVYSSVTTTYNFYVSKDQYDKTVYDVLFIPGAFMAFMLFAL